MTNARTRRSWLSVSLWIAISLPALGQHSIRCGDITLLGASGYPGWNRAYEIRGHCSVYSFTMRDAYGFGGPHIGPLPTTFNKGVEHNEEEVVKFEAVAKVRWNGKTGQVHESMLIGGKKLSTSVHCAPADPFINEGSNTTCKDAQAAGDVDMKIVTAIIQSQRPVFARAVNESLAQMLSWQSDKGTNPPSPPPTPAPRIPSAKSGAAGASRAFSPAVPAPASGQKRPGGGSSAAGFALIVVSPTPAETPRARRLALPTPYPRSSARRSAPSPSPTPTLPPRR